MNKDFKYAGYSLNQEISLEIRDWYDREIIKPLIITGIIEDFWIGQKETKLWINYKHENGFVTFKDNTTAYLNSGWEDIEFINRYIKK